MSAAYLTMRQLLETLQQNEPHHRLVGTKDARGNHRPIDEVCGECPARRPCWKISIAMSDLHNGSISEDDALIAATVALSQVKK